MPQENVSPDNRILEQLWFAACGFFGIALAVVLLCSFRFPEQEMMSTGIYAVLLAALSMCLLRSRRGYKIGVVLSAMQQYALICGGMAMLALCLATLKYPWFDAPLLAMDRALNYSWHDYAKWIVERRRLFIAYDIAYNSIIWQPFLIFLSLSFSNEFKRISIYLISTFITLSLTIMIFTFFPVTTAWAYENIVEISELRRLYLPLPSEGWIYELVELREGRGRLIHSRINAGIIGFPSFHCAAAVLNGWAMWKMALLRYFSMAINGVMIAATPLLGGHYLADIFVGAVVAAVSIYVGSRSYAMLVRRREAGLRTGYRPLRVAEGQMA